MSEKRTYKLNILGSELTLKSDDPQEHVEEVLNFVNQKISEFQSRSKSLTPQVIAILSALNIADELIKLKKEKNMTIEKYSSKLSQLNEAISEALK
jgi:cell division protein ZapA